MNADRMKMGVAFIIAAICILLVSASFAYLEDGQGYRIRANQEKEGLNSALVGAFPYGVVLRGLGFLVVLACVVAVVRKSLRRWALLVAVAGFVLLLLATNFDIRLSGGLLADEVGQSRSEDRPLPEDTRPLVLLEEMEPHQMPAVISYFGALTVFGLAGFIVFKVIKAGGKAPVPRPPFHTLSTAAADSLKALDSGQKSYADVIRECYAELQQLAAINLGRARAASMTPSEYCLILAEQKLPVDALQTLTRLYEKIHYGEVQPSSADNALARSALASLAASCRPRRDGQ